MTQDVNCGSRIQCPDFCHPGSKIQGPKSTGSWIRIGIGNTGIFHYFFGIDTEKPNPYLYNVYNAVVFDNQKVTAPVRPKSGKHAIKIKQASAENFIKLFFAFLSYRQMKKMFCKDRYSKAVVRSECC